MVHLDTETGSPVKRIHLREREIYIHTKTCPRMFIALLIITKSWRQLECPSTGEWTSIHPCHRLLLSHKRTENECDTNEPQKHCAQLRKFDAKGRTLYDSVYMRCPE